MASGIPLREVWDRQIEDNWRQGASMRSFPSGIVRPKGAAFFQPRATPWGTVRARVHPPRPNGPTLLTTDHSLPCSIANSSSTTPNSCKENCRRRGAKADVDRFVALEGRRKTLQTEVEQLNRKANELSKSIGKAKDAGRSRCAEGPGARASAGRPPKSRRNSTAIAAEQEAIHRSIPNISHPDAPVGADDQANLELSRGKTPLPTFDFQPLDHVELGEKLDLVDFEGGARVAGHGFYFLKNEAVLLELALERYALEVLLAEGFTPMTTPDLARNDVLEGIGFIPRGPETQIYSIEQSDLSLVATAEITLGGLLAGQTIDAELLPLKLCGISHCFRTEAGAHGRATRGLFRVHQFTKIEMFAFTLPERKRRHAGVSPRPGVPAVRRPGRALSRGGHGHRRPGRAGLSQVRPGGLDARPGRAASSAK